MAASTDKTIGLILLLILIIAVAGILSPFIMVPFVSVTKGLAGLRHLVAMRHMNFEFGLPVFPSLIGMLSFIIWIIIIFWVYSDAERRGMSGILWALLVFIGNIVGLLIYLIVRAGNYPTTPVQRAPAVTTLCPSCSKPVQQDFKLCPHCGKSLRNQCPSCGKNTSPEWKVCPYCGHSIS